MNWTFYAVDLIGNAMEEMVAVSLFRAVSGRRTRSPRALFLICVLFAVARLVPSMLLNQRELMILSMLVCVAVISFSFEMAWMKRLVFIVLFFVSVILTEMLVGLLLTSMTGIPVAEGREMIFFYAAGVLISKMLMFSLLKVGQFLIPSFGEKIPGYLLIPMLVLPAATFAATCVLAEYCYADGLTSRTYVAVGALILLAVSNTALFFLFEHQQREEREKNKARLLQQQMADQVAYYQALAERQKVSNKTMHDLKNQMFALAEAIKNEPEQAQDRMKEISDRIFAASPMTVTGNEALDALIFAKRQQMEAEQIRYMQSVYVSPGSRFDSLDMCVLLGNLLDNAIEACRKVKPEKRRIVLKITQQGPCLSVSVTNSIAARIQVENNTVRTTKDQPALHGFGLSSIREIAEKYSGNFTFRSSDTEFTACVLLQED